jgi:SAM-dependent methyltransferase
MTMADYYRDHFKAYAERTLAVDPGAFLAPFLAFLPAGASLLDVGCGAGRDLLWFKNRGFPVTGFEKSPGLARIARETAGCRVVEGDFETFDFSCFSFDAVLASAAFVHIPHQRLPQVVANVSRALVKRGFFYISLKKGEGRETDETGRAFYLWQKRDLMQIFDRLGLAVLTVSTSESALNSKDKWLGWVLRAAG